MIMGQNSPAHRRCRGRPQIRSDEDTRALIVDAAAEEFQANGYAATTMGAVAQRAGISTKTMYRLIPNKAELFKSVIAKRIGLFMLEFDLKALDTYDLEEAVEHILVAFGSLTLEKETIALVRLVISESDRFPELAATFHDVAVVQTTKIMARWLERQRGLGRLAFEDTQAAASALRGMMTMDLQRTAMLGLSKPPTAKEIAERARFCAKLFLDGCKAGNSHGA
jgi:AcrR family transcriptional regulator